MHDGQREPVLCVLLTLSLLASASACVRPRIDPATQAEVCEWFRFEPFETPVSDARPAPSDELVLEAGACFGECPQYQLTLKGDGRVILVVLKGPLVGLEDYTISPARAAHAFTEFDALGFSARPFAEGAAVSCSRSLTITRRVGGVTTSVRQERVGERDAERFTHLQRLLETVTRVGEHLALCPPLD